MTISNRLGLHARPATLFARTAQGFEAEVHVRLPDVDAPVDGKSVLMMLSLGATCGTKIEIVASGSDAADAIRTLAALIEGKFEED